MATARRKFFLIIINNNKMAALCLSVLAGNETLSRDTQANGGSGGTSRLLSQRIAHFT